MRHHLGSMITHDSSGKISDPLLTHLLPSATTLDASYTIAKLGGYFGPISKAIAIVLFGQEIQTIVL